MREKHSIIWRRHFPFVLSPIFRPTEKRISLVTMGPPILYFYWLVRRSIRDGPSRDGQIHPVNADGPRDDGEFLLFFSPRLLSPLGL